MASAIRVPAQPARLLRFSRLVVGRARARGGPRQVSRSAPAEQRHQRHRPASGSTWQRRRARRGPASERERCAASSAARLTRWCRSLTLVGSRQRERGWVGDEGGPQGSGDRIIDRSRCDPPACCHVMVSQSTGRCTHTTDGGRCGSWPVSACRSCRSRGCPGTRRGHPRRPGPRDSPVCRRLTSLSM